MDELTIKESSRSPAAIPVGIATRCGDEVAPEPLTFEKLAAVVGLLTLPPVLSEDTQAPILDTHELSALLASANEFIFVSKSVVMSSAFATIAPAKASE